MIASEKGSMAFGHNTNLLDASFSPFSSEEQHFMLKLTHPPQINTRKKVEDEEIGIFGAEKYFTGAIGEELLRTPNKKAAQYRSKRPPEKHEQTCPAPKPKTPSATPSVRSESSGNSRKGLLISSSGNDKGRKSSVKSLLATLGCNCNDKASVKINDNRVHIKQVVKQPVNAGDSAHKTKSLSSRWANEDVHGKKLEFNEMNIKRENCFTFPVLVSSMAKGKNPELPEAEREEEITPGRTRRNSSEVFGSPVLENGKKSFSLERKLTMLNWDGVTPRAEIIDISRNGVYNDTGSDASSDLFELESFSTNENNSFLARQALEHSDGRPSNVNGYAPSEASVDWSVITASAAAEDMGVSKPYNSTVSPIVKARGDTERLKASGILSGCKNLKAVRVSGDEDEHCMIDGEKATTTMREWCRRLDSTTPAAKIQANTKLKGTGFDSHRGQNGFGTARPVAQTHFPHASHRLYVQ